MHTDLQVDACCSLRFSVVFGQSAHIMLDDVPNMDFVKIHVAKSGNNLKTVKITQSIAAITDAV